MWWMVIPPHLPPLLEIALGIQILWPSLPGQGVCYWVVTSFDVDNGNVVIGKSVLPSGELG